LTSCEACLLIGVFVGFVVRIEVLSARLSELQELRQRASTKEERKRLNAQCRRKRNQIARQAGNSVPVMVMVEPIEVTRPDFVSTGPTRNELPVGSLSNGPGNTIRSAFCFLFQSN